MENQINWSPQITSQDNSNLQSNNSVMQNRFIIPLIVGVFSFLFLIYHLVNLQIVRGDELFEKSQNNYMSEIPIEPQRGIIYDANGQKLVENLPSNQIILDIRNLSVEDVNKRLNFLETIISLDRKEILKKIASIQNTNYQYTVLIANDIDHDKALKFKTENKFSDLYLVDSSIRHYLYPLSTAHLLGYVGEASETDVEQDPNIYLGDIIGKDGIEAYYNKYLYGKKGTKIVEVDATMNTVLEYEYEQIPPENGVNLTLSIDIKLQEYAYKLLDKYVDYYDGTAGSIVIEEIDTGRVKVLANYPSFDNNIFVNGIEEDEIETYQKIIEDTRSPLLNRAISEAQPPGSTFKTIVATAILDSHAIDENVTIDACGIIYIGADHLPIQDYHRHVYGPLNVVGGICKSSNIFFCTALKDYSSIEEFLPYAQKFNIGDTTGIDLPGEATGMLPSPENKKKLAETTSPWLDPIWYDEGDTCITAFGQGITTVTPIQLATAAAAIANEGTIYKPRVVQSITYPDGTIKQIEPVVKHSNIASSYTLDLVKQGMYCSANKPNGVIVPLFYAKVPVAAKTGTAEFGIKDESGYYTQTHAWVMGFFPYDNPKYSFTVFIEAGGESNNSANVAKELINYMVDNEYIDNAE